MLDMGWTEILVIGVVALIVVGPKDLPRMLRTLGQYTGKLRGMAREFQRSMDDAAREADLEELKDIKNTLNDVRAIQNDAKGAIRQGFNKIDQQIEKDTDLKVEDIDETAPKPATQPKAEPKPMATSAAPVDKPDPSAGMKSGPEPGDLVDDPAPATAGEPRTASGT